MCASILLSLPTLTVAMVCLKRKLCLFQATGKMPGNGAKLWPRRAGSLPGTWSYLANSRHSSRHSSHILARGSVLPSRVPFTSSTQLWRRCLKIERVLYGGYSEDRTRFIGKISECSTVMSCRGDASTILK